MQKTKKLDDLIAIDRQRQVNERQCLMKIAEEVEKLRNAVADNPRAVADFLDLKLIVDRYGRIQFDNKGNASGYVVEGIPVHDSGLKDAIRAYSATNSKECRSFR